MITRLNSYRNWAAIFLAWGAIIAWSHRQEMDPDGFSYLQMAARCSAGDPSALVNSYWSPAYPALLALFLALFRPAPGNAFALQHLVNYFIYVISIGAFFYFVRHWRRRYEDREGLLLPLACILFLKFAIDLMGPHHNTPDLLVGVSVLLAAGILCRMGEDGASWTLGPFWLGLALAAGCYSKAAMFPISAILLLLLLLVPPYRDGSRGRVWVSVAVLALAVTPLVMLQSRAAGRLSFGESGSLNYVWYVNGVPGVQTGGDPRLPVEHPPRRLTEHPLTLEFGSPVQATYPLWFEPAYWAKGLRPSFEGRRQIEALERNLMGYAHMSLELAPLIVGAAVILFAGRPRKEPPFHLRELWMWAWPLGVLCMYAAVHIEERFFGGFLILLWAALLAGGMRRHPGRSYAAVMALICAALILPTTLRLGLAVKRSVSGALHPGPTIDVTAAQALRDLGLHKGDGILVVGATFEPYYAWIAGVRVVAQVTAEDELWRLSPADFQSWLAIAARSGAKALVALDRPSWANQVPWRDLPASSKHSSTILGPGPHHYSVFPLQ